MQESVQRLRKCDQEESNSSFSTINKNTQNFRREFSQNKLINYKSKVAKYNKDIIRKIENEAARVIQINFWNYLNRKRQERDRNHHFSNLRMQHRYVDQQDVEVQTDDIPMLRMMDQFDPDQFKRFMEMMCASYLAHAEANGQQ